MFIINDTYFQEDRLIPNLGNGGIGSVGNVDIEPLIDSECRSLLDSVLGYKAFKEFSDSLDVKGEIKPDTPQKWIDLINGLEYEKNGITYYYRGLKYSLGASKNSLLAYYVYYKWIDQNVSKSTGVGEVVLQSKNAINVGLTSKLVDIWNKFWTMLGAGYEYNGSHYHHCGVPISDYYGKRRNSNISLFQFLNDNSETYGKLPLQLPANDSFYGYKNQLGL